ncbi:hypothetical protein QTI24_24830 [Variovorax sp. J22P240]|uniref:hypothetical protein n=1 Tax=Variovorax sp. J22P240 TaxID=3053514 RepID=UPI002576C565|nr:hypothetical protein [Variovorax sp. J22P240]MDM0001857.1 hypothetical protein [Variovorax sp. J22P240]
MLGLQHNHHDVVIASLHTHLDHDHCMKTVVLRGAHSDSAGLRRPARGAPGRAPWQRTPRATRQWRRAPLPRSRQTTHAFEAARLSACGDWRISRWSVHMNKSDPSYTKSSNEPALPIAPPPVPGGLHRRQHLGPRESSSRDRGTRATRCDHRLRR